jgi:glyoxylase-like metal-dependent hydrolase (beta-lactamase superfamily II)
MVRHVTASSAEPLAALPEWATLVRAPNPGPMTLDGTNSWIIRPPGSRAAMVVDPGPLDEPHLAALTRCGPVDRVLLTHGHADHVEGVARLLQLLGGADLVGGARGDPAVDGAAYPLGDLVVRVLITPGHTADSVSYLVEVAGAPAAVLTGDTILGRGTTVVAWPDGDLGDYLVSLRRLAGLGPLPVLPGHGPPLADCAAAARYYLRHRLARLDQVRAARANGALTPRQVVELVYADVDPQLWPAAEWSVRAQFAYLESRRPRECETSVTGWDQP